MDRGRGMTLSPFDDLCSRLQARRLAPGKAEARCPAHEDRRASLSIAEGDDGRVLLHDHAGCELAAILSAIGMKAADLFVPKNKLNGNGRHSTRAPAKANKTTAKRATNGRAFATLGAAIEHVGSRSDLRGYTLAATYDYHDGAVARWECEGKPKEIRPLYHDHAGWHVGGMPEPRPLYRVDDVASTDVVWIV